MNTIREFLSGAPISAARRQQAAGELRNATDLSVYADSIEPVGGYLLALAARGRARRLVAAGQDGRLAEFADLAVDHREMQGIAIAIVPTHHRTACVLRKHVPWTSPRLCGLATSAGLGDRLGLATPGHIRAVRGSGCVPFLAQQSIREMTRTQRSPDDVMDDAAWGVFQAGWREGFGSDADHLKTTADIDTTASAGFTMFTIDPGDHVCAEADALSAGEIAQRVESLPWSDLETSISDVRHRYLTRPFPLADAGEVSFSDESLLRAVVKYGRAIAHTTTMYRHLVAIRGTTGFELEVSVDETDTPTTEAEHFFVSSELKRLGVKWVSMAPRFIGEFEKGIDYKGDLQAFEESFARHAAIARTLGPYKLSLHSGSDKFSVYPIAARLSEGLVHLKTAGTSYLEALRVIARVNPGLFRQILDFAFDRFEADRASYHISARIETVPQSHSLSDDTLETILDSNDGRQLLHVTYGSVLTCTNPDGGYRFRHQIRDSLIDHEETHYAVVADHIGKHVGPFVRP